MTTATPTPNLNGFFLPPVLSRGKELYKQGHVLDIDIFESDDGSFDINAVVIGSRGDDYAVNVIVSQNRIAGYCDCAYSINCKHAVATYLAAKPQLQNATKTLSIDDWLKNLAQLTSPNPAPTNNHTNDVHYLLDVDGTTPGFALVKKRTVGSTGAHFFTPYDMDEFDPHLTQLSGNDRFLVGLFQSGAQFYTTDGNDYVRIPPNITSSVVRSLVQSQRSWHKENRKLLTWQATPKSLCFNWQNKGEDIYRYAAVDEKQILIESWIPGDPPLYIDGNKIGPLTTTLPIHAQHAIRSIPPTPSADIGRVNAHLAYYELAPQKLPNENSPEKTSEQFINPACQIHLSLIGVTTKAQGTLPAIKLEARYGPKYFALNNTRNEGNIYNQIDIFEKDQDYYALKRSQEAEFLPQDFLKHLDFGCFDYQEGSGLVWVPTHVHPRDHILHWHRSLAELEAKITEHNWSLNIESSYQTAQKTANFSGDIIESQSGWFDLAVNIDVDGLKLLSQDLITQWLEAGSPNHLPVQNEDKHWVIVNMEQVNPIIKTLFELYDGPPNSEKLRIPRFKAFELDEEAFNFSQAPSIRRMRKEFLGFSGITPTPASKRLKASLREYQQKGLNWLNFLFRYQLGGILADDMGLGKTLQTLAFIQKLKASRKLNNKALIVAPTSVLWNWGSECERFTPNLKYIIFHGNDRHQSLAQLEEVDIIITSYALIQRDYEIYENADFTLIVLDEAQNIKNANAKRTQTVKSIDATMKLALTGTPLENHLGELWSIMDFALPNLLGTQDAFRQRFRSPIERFADEDTNKILCQKIAPFMMRRTKELVAKELPPKTEIIQEVHLAKDQRNLYEGVRISMEKKVRKLIQEKGAERSHIEFLDALLKLRQTCIAPQIVNIKQASKVKNSAKLDWLADTLPELVSEGKKVLIFSQFTKVLELIQRLVEDANIPHVKLTGKTRRREEAIDQFQKSDTPIFLISLKAGGAGLNLTAADTVIHVDPWWNPAVENQATDRAYRIGQDKPVFVYKLVAKDTVEEKIQQMQKDKQALADKLFDASNKTNPPKTGDELLALFS